MTPYQPRPRYHHPLRRFSNTGESKRGGPAHRQFQTGIAQVEETLARYFDARDYPDTPALREAAGLYPTPDFTEAMDAFARTYLDYRLNLADMNDMNAGFDALIQAAEGDRSRAKEVGEEIIGFVNFQLHRAMPKVVSMPARRTR